MQIVDTRRYSLSAQHNVFKSISCLPFKYYSSPSNIVRCAFVFKLSSSNIISYSVFLKINAQPKKSTTKIVQLDRTKVKVLRKLKDVLIRLSSNPKVFQIIDINDDDEVEAHVGSFIPDLGCTQT